MDAWMLPGSEWRRIGSPEACCAEALGPYLRAYILFLLNLRAYHRLNRDVSGLYIPLVLCSYHKRVRMVTYSTLPLSCQFWQQRHNRWCVTSWTPRGWYRTLNFANTRDDNRRNMYSHSIGRDTCNVYCLMLLWFFLTRNNLEFAKWLSME